MYQERTHADLERRQHALERRLHALELEMIRVASHADQAWEAEKARVKASHDFWWVAYRLVVIATVVLAWGLVLFGKR